MPSSSRARNKQQDQNSDGQSRETTESRSNLNLGPFNDAVRTTLSNISDTQKSFEHLKGLFGDYIHQVEAVPGIHQRLEETQQQLDEKDKKINDLENALDVLDQRKEEKDAKLRQKVKELSEQEEALQKGQDNLEKRKDDLKNRQKIEAVQQKAALDKERDEQRIALERQRQQLEDEAHEELSRLNNENRNLRKIVEERETALAALNTKYTDKKGQYKREKIYYETRIAELETALRQMKTELALCTKPTEHYIDEFGNISRKIEEVSHRYFQHLPSTASTKDLDGIQRSLRDCDPVFKDTPLPLSTTKDSEDLRVANAQRVISSSLSRLVWQDFSSERTSKEVQATALLKDISVALAKTDGCSEKAWRALTIRGLESLTSSPPSRAETAVQAIVSILGPLVEKSDSAALQSDLFGIAKLSIALWKEVQEDEVSLRIEERLDRTTRDAWRSEFEEDWSSAEDRPIKASPNVLCLFPRILRAAADGESREMGIVHPGCGLSEDSPLVVRGQWEQEGVERAMEEAMTVYISQKTSGHSRSNSLVQPPSPTLARRNLAI